jgi:hypothetical protein
MSNVQPCRGCITNPSALVCILRSCSKNCALPFEMRMRVARVESVTSVTLARTAPIALHTRRRLATCAGLNGDQPFPISEATDWKRPQRTPPDGTWTWGQGRCDVERRWPSKLSQARKIEKQRTTQYFSVFASLSAATSHSRQAPRNHQLGGMVVRRMGSSVIRILVDLLTFCHPFRHLLVKVGKTDTDAVCAL